VAYNLTDLLLIGSSRMRTFFYDLLLFLGIDEESMKPQKKQVNFNHTVHFDLSSLGRRNNISNANTATATTRSINVHFHWLNCRVDIDKSENIKNNYKHSIENLKKHFVEIGVCNSRNVSLTSRPHRFAVVFATGICEADRSNHNSFKTQVQAVVDFVYQECWEASVVSAVRATSSSRCLQNVFNVFIVR